MKPLTEQDRALSALFDGGRVDIPSDGFTRRVMVRLIPAPSRNMYRIPTLAASLASVILIVVVALTGFDFYGFTVDVATRMAQRFDDRAQQHDRVDQDGDLVWPDGGPYHNNLRL